jgi:6-phosphogluconolactonase
MTNPDVHVLPDADALATEVARRLVDRLAAVQAQGRVPALGLTGGTIAERLYAEMARLHQDGEDASLDWARVDFWWGDERYVPTGDEQRNAGQARATLLDRVPVDPARVHEMPASDGPYDDVEAAAAAYSDEVRQAGFDAFDVLLLGLGENGHVASLMPGHPQLDVHDRVAVAVTDSPKPPPVRISLTYDTLNRSHDVWFIVSGEGKAEATARALGGADLHEIPAAGVRAQQGTVWFVDEAAASRLPR